MNELFQPSRFVARFLPIVTAIPSLRVFCAALLGCALLPGLPAQPVDQGGIEGRVVNQANHNYLNNAHVTVVGTSLEAFTTPEGKYLLKNVPVGEVVLRVDYAGLPAQTASVQVKSRQIAERNFDLQVISEDASGNPAVTLATYVVAATQLSAQASAINEQRQAPNIKNVVALEEFGDLADGNVGEYLKYTPGLAVSFGPQVAGSVSIRGMPASGTIVMLDGVEITSPSADRSFDLTSSAAGAIDRVEVTKVPTPDLPANAVGGTINIIGKSGFSLPRASLKLAEFATYNSFDGIKPPSWGARKATDPGTNMRRIQPGFDFSYAQPLNQSFAFTLNASRSMRFYNMEYDVPTWDMVKLIETTARYEPVHQTIERELLAGTIDWRIGPHDSLRLNLQHNQQNANTRQNDFFAIFGAGAIGGPDFTQGASTGVDTIRQTPTWGDRTKGTTLGLLSFIHTGPIWKIELNGNASSSWDERKDLEDGFFRSLSTVQQTNLLLRADGVGGISSQTADVITAKSRTGQPVDIVDSGNMTIGAASSQPNRIASNMQQANLKISREFHGRIPFSLMTGGTLDRQRKDSVAPTRSWTFTPPGGAAGNLAKNFDFVNEDLSTQSFYSGVLRQQWISPIKVYNLFKAHPEYFVENPATTYIGNVTNSTALEERISAAFLRGDLKLFDNKLWLVGGVRFERTEDHGYGPTNDIRATYVAVANGDLARDSAGRLIPITTDALAKARLQYKERGTETRKHYSGYYPSLNLSYSFSDSLVARAAYARTIGRPPLSEIIPGVVVADPAAAAVNRTVTVINSGLRPWTADNFDLSLEAYNVKGAVISLSGFRKNVSNFFGVTQLAATPALLAQYGFSDDYLDYEIVTKSNFGNAAITGVELSWRQSLSVISPLTRGFQVYANVTKMKLSGDNAADFTPFTPLTFNGGISYIRHKFSIKYNVNWSDEVTGARVAPSASVPANTFQYVAAKTTADLSVDFQAFKHFTVYASVRNLTGSAKRTLRAAPGTPQFARPVNYQNYGSLVTIGLREEF